MSVRRCWNKDSHFSCDVVQPFPHCGSSLSQLLFDQHGTQKFKDHVGSIQQGQFLMEGQDICDQKHCQDKFPPRPTNPVLSPPSRYYFLLVVLLVSASLTWTYSSPSVAVDISPLLPVASSGSAQPWRGRNSAGRGRGALGCTLWKVPELPFPACGNDSPLEKQPLGAPQSPPVRDIDSTPALGGSGGKETPEPSTERLLYLLTFFFQCW